MISFIRLARSIQDNPLWFSEPFTRAQAWVDILLMVNHKETFFYKRGVKVIVKRGQLGRSQKELADRWKWSRGKVDRFLSELETEQQIEQQKNKVVTLITIINYEKFNNNDTTDRATDGQQTEQQTDTYNKLKETKEPLKKKIKNTFVLKKPSVNEIHDYMMEIANIKGYVVDLIEEPEKFHDFYESKGWKVSNAPMKDWKASVRNWLRNNYSLGGKFSTNKKRKDSLQESYDFLDGLDKEKEEAFA